MFDPKIFPSAKSTLRLIAAKIPTTNSGREVPKATRVPIKKGNKILLQCGGGGGYGDPKERDHSKIIDDVKQGYLSKEYVNKYYPDVKL